MKTEKDYSYGVVPVRKEAGVWKVFVLHQISRANTYWTFPKGHAEGEEDAKTAALRELAEETGITAVELYTNHPFEHSYEFIYEDTRVEKTVTYFVGVTDASEFTLQPEEVLEAQWCTFEEARVLLTYDLAKELLDEVQVFLQDT